MRSTSRSSPPTAPASSSPATGIEVASVAELTDGQTTVGGQVKTFHHAVYAGILARRDVPGQMAELEAQGIVPIDLVIVNVKPFAPAVGVKLVGIDEAIEMIDVGGAALLGAAARNSAGVAAASDPSQYDRIIAELREHGLVSPETRAQLAAEAFSMVAAYHAEIAAYLNQISGNTFPRRLAMVLEKVDDLRYGENPHQRAAFYRETTHRSGTLADATQLQGDRPSFNNLLDLDAAYRIARDYTAPTVAIVKHTDPVGLASDDELVEAYRHALETDPVASFGGIVGGQSRARRRDGARDRRELVRGGRRARLQPVGRRHPAREVRPRAARGPGRPDRGHARLRHRQPRLQAGRAAGCSSRPWTTSASTAGGSRSSRKRRPTLEELTDLLFAWRAVRHVRSNAIVLARNGATVGIGAGAGLAPGLGRDRAAPRRATGPGSR